jgi:hypothetical protein
VSFIARLRGKYFEFAGSPWYGAWAVKSNAAYGKVMSTDAPIFGAAPMVRVIFGFVVSSCE